MWKTVIIDRGEKLIVRDNWLHIIVGEEERRLPLGDLYAVVLDNSRASVSQAAMTALSAAGVHLILCGAQHLPEAVLLPLNRHSTPFAAFQRQLTLNDEARALLWQAIVRRKIENQADCLRLAGVKHEKYEEIQALAAKVEPGDVRNVEATAARKYFTALFGCTFTRADDDITNAALNYGYAILRSSVAKTLAGYGFNCVLGLHHKSPTNPFNLADDLMEPLRPLVDLLVDTMCDELFEKLTAENRRELVSLVNLPVRFDGKTMRARYAIDRAVASLTSFLSTGSLDAFKLPTLLKIDRYYRDEQDD